MFFIENVITCVPNLNLKFTFEAKLAFVANYVHINFTTHMINK